MAITVIVELQAKPGGRDQLRDFLDNLISTQGANQPGFLGSTRYEVLDNPDMLIEIAELESVEARQTHMEESAATGTYAPLLELVASPFRATVIQRLS